MLVHLLCLALIPPTIFERSVKFTRTKTDRDRQLRTWGGNVSQSHEAYDERRHLIHHSLQEWFDGWAVREAGNMLAFILGYKDGNPTKIYYFDSATGIHRGKELGAVGERKYIPVNYNEYEMVPDLFVEHFGDAPGEGRVRYDIDEHGGEVRQSFHLTLQYTEWLVRDKRRELAHIIKARGCNITAFEEWYQQHSSDRMTCIGFETDTEAVTIYHADDSYYDEMHEDTSSCSE